MLLFVCLLLVLLVVCRRCLCSCILFVFGAVFKVVRCLLYVVRRLSFAVFVGAVCG